MVAELASTVSPEESGSPLLNAPTPTRKRELLLVVSSDRGLCGAYNANVLRVAARYLCDQKAAGVDTVVETVGKESCWLLPIPRHRDRQPLRTGR